MKRPGRMANERTVSHYMGAIDRDWRTRRVSLGDTMRKVARVEGHAGKIASVTAVLEAILGVLQWKVFGQDVTDILGPIWFPCLFGCFAAIAFVGQHKSLALANESDRIDAEMARLLRAINLTGV